MRSMGPRFRRSGFVVLRDDGRDANQFDAALRWGIDDEESRAAAAPVSGIHSRARRAEGTVGYWFSFLAPTMTGRISPVRGHAQSHCGARGGDSYYAWRFCVAGSMAKRPSTKEARTKLTVTLQEGAAVIFGKRQAAARMPAKSTSRFVHESVNRPFSRVKNEPRPRRRT
jgi:hypothetical protein